MPPAIANRHVVAETGEQPVVTRLAKNTVVAASAEDTVGKVRAGNAIVAGSGGKDAELRRCRLAPDGRPSRIGCHF
jgi:hypothetical protein